MKTTIEISDTLFHAAKAAAVQRRTTLKALFTHALERELLAPDVAPDAAYELSEDGIPYLPSRGETVTNDTVYRLLDDED